MSYIKLRNTKKKIIALVDCNSFYVSCERLFNPILNRFPVVVLSNNDGCVISRSKEAKEIGIRKALGAPPSSIKLIIVLESVFVTAISGYIGLVLGGLVLNSFDLEDYWITDPGVSTSLVVGATFTLILAGLIAAYVPANRAASIKPIVALRDE